jgi:hypothetical protein
MPAMGEISANLGKFSVNLRPFWPFAVNPAKNRIYAVYDQGIKVCIDDFRKGRGAV